MSNPKLSVIIVQAIKMGKPILLENIEETLDPQLEPLLQKSIQKYNGVPSLKMGDEWIMYNFEFRFVMTTKLANPHYLPEICIKVTLINFTVTPSGLEEQLLVEVVKNEKPEIE
jgi:dynein heavy chain